MYRMSTTIYKITSTAGDKVYIGSTTQKLQRRLMHHISHKESVKGDSTTSRYLFSIYGVDTCSIEVIEEVKSDERQIRERYWIERYGSLAVNEKKPGRTYKEYAIERYEKNGEIMRAQAKKRYEEKKDDIKSSKKVRILCECGMMVQRTQKARHIKSKAHLSKVNELSDQTV